MPSLNQCLKKFKGKLTSYEKRKLLDISQSYRADGNTPEQASTKAIREAIAELEKERDSILNQVSLSEVAEEKAEEELEEGKEMTFKATTKFDPKLKKQGVWQNITDSWDGTFDSAKEASLDTSNHIVKDVCIFGSRVSKNGYIYTDKAINSLCEKTHGAKFFINHPSQSEVKERDGVRDIQHWAGVFLNPRREGEKVKADLKVRPTYWDLVYDVATMQPANVGNSINSRVKVMQNEKGEESIADIDYLKSIDLVANAATTQNLWESVPEDTVDKRVADLETFAKEGLLKDKIKNRAIERQISKLQWDAQDVINDVIMGKDKDMADKKKSIASIMDDLESEINLIMSGKGTDKSDSATAEKEQGDMDFKDITIETLSKERPDLISDLKATMEDAERITKMDSEFKELQTKLGDLEKVHTELKENSDKAIGDLKKENEDLKKKLETFQSKEKSEAKRSVITEKIEAAKLPKDAVSDFFFNDLMGKDDEDIDSAITDRKEMWTKDSGKVTGSGSEQKLEDKVESKEGKEKADEAKDKFAKAMTN